MTLNSVLLRGVALVAVLSACGCYESDTPLDPMPQLQADSRLLGSWRCVSSEPGNDEILVVTVTAGGDRRYAITTQEPGEEPERVEAFASSLKDVTVLNVKDSFDPRPWHFIEYRLLQDDVLRLRLVHERLLKGVPPQLLRKTIEAQRANPALYEDYAHCVRIHASSL
jgi:hypothetical protein